MQRRVVVVRHKRMHVRVNGVIRNNLEDAFARRITPIAVILPEVASDRLRIRTHARTTRLADQRIRKRDVDKQSARRRKRRPCVKKMNGDGKRERRSLGVGTSIVPVTKCKR